MLMRMTFSTITKTSELGSASLNRLVTPTGSTKNRPMPSASDSAIVPAQAAPPISSFLPSSSTSSSWAFAEMPSALKPIFSDSPSATMPRMIGSRSSRWRLVQETSGSEVISISPSAASFGSRPSPWCASSCSGVGLRTATAHVETPRIITPSSTA
jgi:hypothetical protein